MTDESKSKHDTKVNYNEWFQGGSAITKKRQL